MDKNFLKSITKLENTDFLTSATHLLTLLCKEKFCVGLGIDYLAQASKENQRWDPKLNQPPKKKKSKWQFELTFTSEVKALRHNCCLDSITGSSLMTKITLLPWMFILTPKEVALENNQVLGGHLFIAADDFLDSILWTPVTCLSLEYLSTSHMMAIVYQVINGTTWENFHNTSGNLTSFVWKRWLISSLKVRITFWKKYFRSFGFVF